MIAALLNHLPTLVLSILFSFSINYSIGQDCNDIIAVWEVENTNDNCGAWCNGAYAFTLGANNCFTAGEDLTFTEYTNGTAEYSGTLLQNGETAYISVIFTGRTNIAPPESPKYGLCINQGGEYWHYYTDFSGYFTYPNGNSTELTPRGPAFQVGYGANLQDSEYGGAAWFYFNDGEDIGDFNFQLSGIVSCNETEIFLETECAEVGSLFQEHTDNSASNGKYIEISDNYNSMGQAPSGQDARVRFNFEITKSGAYNVFARVKAPSGSDDSFWVRANNGDWVKWNSIAHSNTFIWDQVHDNTNNNMPVSFNLDAGTNSIDFAYREDGTMLDKVMVSMDSTIPTEMGSEAENCDCPDEITVTGVVENNTLCSFGECTEYCFESSTGNPDVFAQMEVNYEQNGSLVTIRTTYAKTFCDNTYGANTIGWPANNHTFRHVHKSDQLELTLYNGNGNESLKFAMDLLHDYDGTFKTGGVDDGDGAMLLGDRNHIIDVKTSISENFITHGYYLIEDSPETDENYTVNPDYPEWIYEVWYEVTIDMNAFGPSGFGIPEITNFHASPSKTGNDTEPLSNEGCCGTDCNGSIDLTVSQGEGPYSYYWSNGETTEDLNGLCPDNYSVTVSDINGCITSYTFIIEDDSPIALECSVETTCDDLYQSDVIVTISGGTGNYDFLWNTGDTTQNLEDVNPGVYQLTVTDELGCSQTCMTEVEEPEALSISCDVNINSCDLTDNEILAMVSGGIAPFTYLWSNGQTSSSLSNVSAGTYGVTVTDNAGCTAICEASISDFEPLSIECYGTPATCNENGTVYNDGTGTIIATGGTGPYIYHWSNNGCTDYEEGLEPGIYTITVTDATGCTQECSIEIEAQANFYLNCVPIFNPCEENQNGVIYLQTSADPAELTYLWSNGETTSNIGDLSQGTYSVTVTHTSGCTKTCEATIGADAPLEIECTSTDITCGETSNGTGTIIVTGGTGPYAYHWSNEACGQYIEGLEEGVYTITVEDANGCHAECTIEILNEGTLDLSCSVTEGACDNNQSGVITTTVAGGDGNYNYIWSNGATTANLENVPVGTYSVTVSDQSGCSAICEATITQSNPVSVSCSSEDISCENSNDGTAIANASGGATPYSYLWSNGNTSQSINNLGTGTYFVTITDNNGCSATCSTLVTANDQLAITCELTDFECTTPNTGNISTFTSGGDGNYSYLWNNGSTTSNIEFTQSGNYRVTVTDGAGCSATCSVEVPEVSPISLSCEAQNGTCAQPEIGSITTTVAGGSGVYTYLWNNGSTTANLTDIEAGDYSLTVTDENGCEAYCQTTVAGPESIEISCIGTDLICGEENTGTISIQVSGGATPYSFLWDDGNTDQDRIDLAEGSYSATVTDANGCSAVCESSVSVPEPIFVLSTATELLCFGDETASADFIIEGGTPPYTYLWSTGDTTPTINNLGAGFYGITVTDANGCIGICGPLIEEPGQIVASFTTSDVSCFNGNDGFISTTITGGTEPYTVQWSNGATNQNIDGLETGEYTITISDENGCTAIFTQIIESNTLIDLTCTPTPLSCSQNNSGSIQLSVNGGTGVYSFAWSSGETTQNLQNIGSGAYSVTVTDSNGCTSSCSTNVEEPASLEIICSAEDLICAGPGTGAITTQVIGGTAPYSYQWSNGETTSEISGLSTGSYTLTITDANGCSAICESSVESSPELIANCEGQDLFCGASNSGSVSVNVSGGTAPYSFDWNTGDTSQNLSDLDAGTYEVTITDAKGCTTTCSSSLELFEPLSVNCVGQDLLCGEANSGSINLEISGGTAPFTYQWSNGTTGQNLNNVDEGTYGVTVTDINGCQAVCSASIVIIETVSVSAVSDDLVCAVPETGRVDITVSGGTPPYSYNWNTGATTEDITNLNEGTYEVTVTDANGCVFISSSDVLSDPRLTVTCNVEAVTCGNSNSGNIDIDIDGGVGPYSILWSNGETTEDLENIPSGSYEVTVTDSKGCIASCSAIVEVSLGLELECTPTGTQCGEDNTGSIDLRVNGGTGNYTFEWSNGATSEDLIDLDAGAYTVTVTDTNGCTGTCTTTVDSSSELEAVCTSEEIPCGGQPDGSIDLEVSGGNGPYTYDWSNGQTTQDIDGVTAGTYSVTIADANGCTTTCSNTITEAPPFQISCVKNDILCDNDSNGSVEVSTGGGVEPISYIWSTGDTTTIIDGLPAGSYTVTATDANGCSTTCSSTINEPSALIVVVNGNDISCNGQTDGTAFATVIGGTVPYTYNWSNGATTQFVNGLAVGSYTLTVTDGNGCQNIGFISINEPEVLSATCNTTNENCQNNAGGVDVEVSGGTAPFTYLWSNGATTEDLSDALAGTYTVTVTDARSCTTVCSSTIEPVDQIVLSCTPTPASCGTPSVGSIDLTVNGGSGIYFFQWSNGTANEDLLNVSAGTYTVTVTDGFGCSEVCTSTIEEAPSVAIQMIGSNVDCHGNATGSINTFVSQGMPPYTYNWSNGATTENITNLTANTYSLTVTDANGCQGIATITITQPSSLLVITSSTPIVCNGDTDGTAFVTALGGISPYTYSWSNGSSAPFINALAAGTYTVTVTDANGCTASNFTTIAEPAPINVSLDATQLLCSSDSNGSIESTVEGGQAPYSYTWSNGSNSSSIDNLPAGTYSVIVTDNNGCSGLASVSIDAANPLILSCNKEDVICYGESNGSVSLDISGGVEPYDILWNTGDTSTDIDDLSAGNYTVTVTDANGCSSVCMTTVNEPEALIADYGSTNITCFGNQDGTLEAIAQGGTAPYVFEWSTGDSTEIVTGLPAGTYGLTLTDANGCIFVCGLIINEATPISCSTEVLPASSGNAGLYDIVVSADGGTGDLQYSIDDGQNYQASATFTDLAPGTYTITIKDEYDCTSTCDATDVGMGLNSENQGRTNMALSPVPASNELNVVYETSEEAFTIFEVKNIDGKTLFREEITTQDGENVVSFNVSQLSGGNYILAIYTAKGVETQQFTILHRKK